MRRTIGEIIEEVKKIKSKKDKAEYIRKNATPQLKEILEMAYNPTIKFVEFDIPEYNENTRNHGRCTNLYVDIRRLRLFVNSPGRTIREDRFKKIYIQMCESLHASEAKIVTDLLKYKKIVGLPLSTIQLAFEGEYDFEFLQDINLDGVDIDEKAMRTHLNMEDSELHDATPLNKKQFA